MFDANVMEIALNHTTISRLVKPRSRNEATGKFGLANWIRNAVRGEVGLQIGLGA